MGLGWLGGVRRPDAAKAPGGRCDDHRVASMRDIPSPAERQRNAEASSPVDDNC